MDGAKINLNNPQDCHAQLESMVIEMTIVYKSATH